jgi:phosphatidylethanolamine/phosphatidyl-N-methylethanolamine N-methyltransferase
VAGNHRNGGILYSRLSGYYDTFFGWITLPRQKLMIQKIGIPEGAKIMEVGVGTGLALPHYPKHCEVMGVDISAKMLKHARKRVAKKQLTHVALEEMDAKEIDNHFPPDTFDYIIGAFVLTVVDDPVRVLKNMKRVGKPDCSIYILNHSKSSHPVLGRCERMFEPFAKKIGWRYDVDLDDVCEKAGLNIVSQKPCYPGDFYTILHAKNGTS